MPCICRGFPSFLRFSSSLHSFIDDLLINQEHKKRPVPPIRPFSLGKNATRKRPCIGSVCIGRLWRGAFICPFRCRSGICSRLCRKDRAGERWSVSCVSRGSLSGDWRCDWVKSVRRLGYVDWVVRRCMRLGLWMYAECVKGICRLAYVDQVKEV